MKDSRWGGALLRIGLFLVLAVLFSLATAGLLAVLGVTFDGRSRLLASSVSLIAAVVVGIVLLRRLDDRQAGALGFALTPAAARESLLGLGIGAGGLAIAALLLLLLGKLAFGPDEGTAAGWAAIVLGDFALLGIAAASEEALFRGYPFQVVAQRFGAVAATVVGSIAFAFAHGANPSVGAFALINIFLAGVLLSVAYLKTCSLWFATALHLGWNWAMASLFDLPVSGIMYFDTPLYEPVVGAPSWLTGGMFGPEGGMVGTIGFAAALVAVLGWKAVRIDDRMRALRPLTLREGVAVDG